MPKKPPPLIPLKKLRQEQEDRRVRELGTALDDAARREEERARAEEQRRALERKAAEVRSAERAELETGALRAGDLAQGAAFAVGARARQEQAERAQQKAAEEVKKAHEEVGRLQKAVAAAKADVDVVERLLAKERASHEARELAALEEAAEDAFRARRHAERAPRG